MNYTKHFFLCQREIWLMRLYQNIFSRSGNPGLSPGAKFFIERFNFRVTDCVYIQGRK